MCPVTEAVDVRIISLPIPPSMSDDNVNDAVTYVGKVIRVLLNYQNKWLEKN